MNELETSILTALIDLEAAVQAMSSASPKPNLLPLFGRLDDLTRRLPEGADPNLRHYLQKKSYSKARLWLEGRDSENPRGGCLGD